jgi:hypothetical protein
MKVLFLYEKTDRLFRRDIVEMLEPFHDRPWEGLRRGREINEWWLGQRLREVGVRSRTIWIGAVSAKGYLRDDFEEALRRYMAAQSGEFRMQSAEYNNRGASENTEPGKAAGGASRGSLDFGFVPESWKRGTED